MKSWCASFISPHGREEGGGGVSGGGGGGGGVVVKFADKNWPVFHKIKLKSSPQLYISLNWLRKPILSSIMYIDTLHEDKNCIKELIAW